jgi:hypothetical protein
MLDAELRPQGPAALHQMPAIDLAARRGGLGIVRRAVRCSRLTGSPCAPNTSLSGPERRRGYGVLFFDQEPGNRSSPVASSVVRERCAPLRGAFVARPSTAGCGVTPPEGALT